MSLLGRLPVPLRRRPVILLHSPPHVMEIAKVILRIRVTLLSGFPVPHRGGGGIPHH